MTIAIIVFIILIALIYSLEISQNTKNDSPLTLSPQSWEFNKKANVISISGSIIITNNHSRMEVMIPTLDVITKLLGKNKFGNIKVSTEILNRNEDLNNRNDDYWLSCIIKSRQSTYLDILITLEDIHNSDQLKGLENLWIEINWINYGPFGLLNRVNGFVIPMTFPDESSNFTNYGGMNNKLELISIKTHILGTLDNPIKTIEKYTSKLLRKGDILTIGETPLAIMQGRYINPKNIRITTLSKLLCRYFHPTSSLATACGMQSLINEAGANRIIISFILGSLFKALKLKGFFYRIAGNQARLIDDITGTTAPYDKSIVLGPKNVSSFCQKASKELGVAIAVVDVNDLGRVKILSSSDNCNENILKEALVSNPAGNADEQTPIVVVRR